MNELKEYAKGFVGVTLYTDGEICRVAISSPISKVKDFPINDKESIKNYIKKNARTKELFFKKIALEHPKIEYKQISLLTKEEYETLLNTLSIALNSLESEDAENVSLIIEKIQAAKSVFHVLYQICAVAVGNLVLVVRSYSFPSFLRLEIISLKLRFSSSGTNIEHRRAPRV